MLGQMTAANIAITLVICGSIVAIALIIALACLHAEGKLSRDGRELKAAKRRQAIAEIDARVDDLIDRRLAQRERARR